jgi:hypothetical protein
LSRNRVFTTDDIVEIKRLTSQDGLSSRKIAEMYGVGKSTIGDLLRKETYTDVWEKEDDKPLAGGNIYNVLKDRKNLEGNKFVFTSAQNNTFVHDSFLKALEVYCEHNGAELIVGRYLYNKNGFQNGEKDEPWFDPKIKKYLLPEGRQVAKGLVWCGELNILPTAVNPLSGLQNYTNDNSGIVPHAKLQMESLPTPKFEDARLMYTTGTVTQRNYISQKSGQKASHHHAFAAVVVEVDTEGDWFVRQLHAESKTGAFYDLDKYYTKTGVVGGCNIEAINYGDIHVAKLDNTVANVSWLAKDSILDTLKPKYQMVNDVLDFQARNHHNVKDSHFMFSMFHNGTEDVKKEIRQTTDVLCDMKRDFSEVVVVESNHDLALLRFLKEQDYRKDPVNAIFFLEMQLATYKAIEARNTNYSCFEKACHVVNSETEDGVRFLRTDESFRVAGIECGQHGHLGVNGARPSVKSFVKQGIRFNTGHTHSPSIQDGVYTAGVSGKLDMGYNKGAGSWVHAHILTYSNGKRTIVTIKNGKWRSQVT